MGIKDKATSLTISSSRLYQRAYVGTVYYRDGIGLATIK